MALLLWFFSFFFVWPKISNLILIMKKHPTDSNQGTFYKITVCDLQNSQSRESIDWGTVHSEGHNRAVKTKCKRRFWIESAAIKYEDRLVAMYQCYLSVVGGLWLWRRVLLLIRNTYYSEVIGHSVGKLTQLFCYTSNFFINMLLFQTLKKNKK